MLNIQNSSIYVGVKNIIPKSIHIYSTLEIWNFIRRQIGIESSVSVSRMVSAEIKLKSNG